MEPSYIQFTLHPENPDLFQIDYDVDWSSAGIFDNEQESNQPYFELPFAILEPPPLQQLIRSVPPPIGPESEVAEFQVPQQIRPVEIAEFQVPQRMGPEVAEFQVPPTFVPLSMTLGQECEQPGSSGSSRQANRRKRDPPKWQVDLETPGLSDEEKRSIKKAKRCKEYRDKQDRKRKELKARIDSLRLSREQDSQEITSNDEKIKALEEEVRRERLAHGI